MSQFGSGMSDPIAVDGDKGFVAVNQRLQLNELQPGEVRESVNGRMEGYWKPRKNVVSKTGSLTTGTTPLQLPFYLIDSAKTISGVTVPTANTVNITVTGHGFAVDSSGWATIAGLDAAFNGSYLLTYVSANILRFTLVGAPTPSVTTGTLSQMVMDDAANANVRASCLFSDPNTGNKEYIVVALDGVAKKIDLATLSITDINYPSGQTVDSDTDMIQVFDKVILFREGKQSFEWDPTIRPIASAVSDNTASPNTVVTVSVIDHGLLAGTSITIVGLTGGTTQPNGNYVVATVTNKDTFTFTASGISTGTTFGTVSATITNGFRLSNGGTYTQPQVFNVTSNNVSATGGLVTISSSGLANTTIIANSFIVIYQTTISELSAFVGSQFQVVSANTTTVTFYAPVGNFTAGGSLKLEFGGRFSVGGGFMHQPGAPWGVYFQRRLWVPYYYDQSGTAPPVYTPRNITDEIAVSDILDLNTFDQIENQFRVSGGTADYVVGMHGFYDDSLVVLNRNSLHVVSGTQGSLLDVVVKELTSEIGCLARKSVVQRGNIMMFLSDDGVYSLEFGNDYNLRGSEEPISKNIQPYIDRINKNFAAEAVGILYDNRYYLAVSLDSSPGANDSYGNNSILVYNFKNNGWESLDTYGSNQFLIKNMILGGAGERNNLYAVTTNGGLHEIDSAESSVDRLNVSNVGDGLVTPTINSSLTSRGYDFDTLDRKRFTDVQVNMQNLAGATGEYEILFATEDPDNAVDIGTTTYFLGGSILAPSSPNEAETASIRCRLGGTRGYTGTIILKRNIGSPKINSIKVAGAVTNRQIISQK